MEIEYSSPYNCVIPVICSNGCTTETHFHTPDSHDAFLESLNFAPYKSLFFHTSFTLLSNCSVAMDPHTEIVIETMTTLFGRSPRAFQLNVIPHILRMSTGHLPCQPTLMVQPTGSGKSSVPLTIAAVKGGVTIIVENTLSLGTDQSSKVDLIAHSSNKKFIKSFHLDSFKSDAEQALLSASILSHCSNNCETSIVIFSSPETLLKPSWIQFINDVHSKHLLNLLCVDEIHLYIEFGTSFRTSFQRLRDEVFGVFKISATTSTIPLLFMTATFNYHLHDILQRMIGFQIGIQNIFWARTTEFQKRHIKIDVSYTLQHFHEMKKSLLQSVQHSIVNKCIIITNTAKRALECKESLDSWLDSKETIKGDSIVVVGNQQTELKFAFTTAFTNTPFNGNDPNLNNDIQPRFLIGTSGCIGAGLDAMDVHLVMRIGLSPSLIDFVQEMGRCGRLVSNDNNTTSSDLFSIVFSIHDYVYLYERIFIEEVDDADGDDEITQNVIMSKEEYRKIEVFRLNEVCSMMFLQLGCWHKYIEKASSNPYDVYHDTQFLPCLNSCPFCTNQICDIVKTVNRLGLCRFLANTMLNATKRYNPIELGDRLYNYPNSGTLIYNRKSAEKPEKKSDCYVTIIQLILVGILTLNIHPSPNPTAVCSVTSDDIEPRYLSNHVWQYIRHI